MGHCSRWAADVMVQQMAQIQRGADHPLNHLGLWSNDDHLFMLSLRRLPASRDISGRLRKQSELYHRLLEVKGDFTESLEESSHQSCKPAGMVMEAA